MKVSGALGVIAAGAVLLAGCGVSVSPSGPAESASPSQPAQASSASEPTPTVDVPTPDVTVAKPSVPTAGSTGSAPAADPQDLPADFPVPDGAHLDAVVRDGDTEIDATLTVIDAAKAFSFWRDGLEDHDYRVVDAQSGFGAYEIRFSGHGCGGDSQIAITGTRAAVQCELS